jgi:thiamine-monophosphate kinase
MKRINEEKKMIEMINGMFPQSERRMSKCFEADAEMISFDDKKLLFTIDEFSAEDMLRDDDPFNLGWNIAAGAISDIYACAGKPLFYAHAMAVSDEWNEDFIKKFSQGIAAVLKETGTVFMGGDLGKSDRWRYTAAVIGQPIKSINRKGSAVGDSIYISGKIGAGNVDAALKIYADDPRFKMIASVLRHRFPLRIKESGLIGEYATSCIDTSDGVLNALNALADINGVGYEIGQLPYVDIGSLGAVAVSLPKELLFLGEAGEYELLCTIPLKDEQVFLDVARQKGVTFYKIGKVVHASRTLDEGQRSIDLSKLHIRARDFDQHREYLECLMGYLKEQK